MEENEKKKFDWIALITVLLILSPIVAGVVLWNRLPPQMARHFDLHGEPDGWSSKYIVVFVFPVILAALQIFCLWQFNRAKKNAGKKQLPEKLEYFFKWIIPIVCIFCSALTYAYALDLKVDIVFWMWLLLAFMFIIIGNYLPKCRYDESGKNAVEIRLFGAMKNRETWNATSRFTGFLMVISGIVLFVCAFTKWTVVGIIAFSSVIVLPILFSFCYRFFNKK